MRQVSKGFLRAVFLFCIVAGAAAPSIASEPVNLEVLETRLRDSEAIDWMQKVQLSAEVEDLKQQIQDRYRDAPSPGLNDLLGQFNALFDAVLAMLRDTDPILHNDMLASRRLIWTTLSQPAEATGS